MGPEATQQAASTDRRIEMEDFGINEMLELQQTLQETYRDVWEGISPEVGKHCINL